MSTCSGKDCNDPSHWNDPVTKSDDKEKTETRRVVTLNRHERGKLKALGTKNEKKTLCV